MNDEELFLVDFENVPGVDLGQISANSRVIVFAGAGQKSVPLELVTVAQRFGDRLEWRRVDAAGPNALDFFIACELGRVLAMGNAPGCTVMSNDKGFDPLLRYLSKVGVKCRRTGTRPAAKSGPKPVPNLAPEPVVDQASLDRVLEILGKSEKKARPRKRKTLAQAIRSFFQKKISEAAVEAIIAEMLRTKKITEKEGAISYDF